jgi:hypothetical protein
MAAPSLFRRIAAVDQDRLPRHRPAIGDEEADPRHEAPGSAKRNRSSCLLVNQRGQRQRLFTRVAESAIGLAGL